MLQFNRFRSKFKNTQLFKQAGIIIRDQKTKKSMLNGRRVVVVGDEGSFLANLLSSVLIQFECKVYQVLLTDGSGGGNGTAAATLSTSSSSSTSTSSATTATDHPQIETTSVALSRCWTRSGPNMSASVNQEELAKVMAVVVDVLRDKDIVVICCEWAEYGNLFDQLDIVSRCCFAAATTNVVLAFPMGVEEDLFTTSSPKSIESIFEGISTSFLFYSALMQWLFVGPPNHNGAIELLINDDQDEGCFWLDCDDFVKVIVELVLQICDREHHSPNNGNMLGDSENRMFILTGKECLTCKEVSNILFSEAQITVQDYHQQTKTPDTSRPDSQRKFFNYLKSPISTMQSPDIESFLNQQPTTFSQFIGKVQTTQLFSKISLRTSISSSGSSGDGGGSSRSSSPRNSCAGTGLTSSTSSSSTPTSPTSSLTSNAVKFVSSPFTFLKYSKALIEESIYKSPATSQKKKNNSKVETNTWISLLSSGFKKMLDTTDTELPPVTPEDFTKEVQYDITDDYQSNWTFTCYSPNVFNNIKKFYMLENFLKSSSSSNGISEFEEVTTIGRSGSFFFRSLDNRYFIKTIPNNEFITFTKIFSSYYQHITKYPNNLLPRFFGLYRLKGKLHIGGAGSSLSPSPNVAGRNSSDGNISQQQQPSQSGESVVTRDRDVVFVIMENLFYSTPQIELHERYDLKGSTVGRYVDVDELDDPINHTLKDLNLKRKIYVGPFKKLMVAQLDVDTEWMVNHFICDYSLLLGIHIPSHSTATFESESNNNSSPDSGSGGSSSNNNRLRLPPIAGVPYSSSSTTTKRTSNTQQKDISFFKKDGHGMLSCMQKPMQVIPIRNGKTISPVPSSGNVVDSTGGFASTGTSSSSSSSSRPARSTLSIGENRVKVIVSEERTSGTTTTTTTTTTTDEHSIEESDELDDSLRFEEGTVYFIGLVDTLTTYDFKKRGEHAIKSVLFDKTQISAISPKDYRVRFLKYVQTIFE
ncbi:hypothetical protein SAMD00019534_063270 [Acytostelium subglobosum LB1]|uniref:hypothetical protein n=1 Tax=Acytostelium subglobosum LB1 TaxID=1410327 RepID=UPI0006449BB5|nr:hypothetical protein SAMD00019534_063270 [Acytostelium subglobosum LB1]GAM23152.1 hypothetical protein SAMD00019534_063270 [Acytostelium subglobosum LB1]|eukprot:XP_012753601.1 hypothetical protein SAMD00019534_063270 [Acytostelium subglobosum LB1]